MIPMMTQPDDPTALSVEKKLRTIVRKRFHAHLQHLQDEILRTGAFAETKLELDDSGNYCSYHTISVKAIAFKVHIHIAVLVIVCG